MVSRPAAAALVIDEGQRVALERLAASQAAPHRQVQRTKALLLAADGVAAVAATPGTSPGLSAMFSARRMVGSNPSSPKAAFRAQPSARATLASLASSGTLSLRAPGASLLPCSAPGGRCRVIGEVSAPAL